MSWIQKLHHSFYSKCRPLSISQRWADFHRFSKAHQHVSWSDSEDKRQTTHSLSCISCQDIEYIYMYYICIHVIHGIQLNNDIQGWTNMYYDMFMVQGSKIVNPLTIALQCRPFWSKLLHIDHQANFLQLSSIKNNASFAWAWSDQNWHIMLKCWHQPHGIPWPSLWILGREELGVGVRAMPLARHQQSLQEGASTSQVLFQPGGSNGLCGYGSKMGPKMGNDGKRTFFCDLCIFLWFSAIMFMFIIHNFIMTIQILGQWFLIGSHVSKLHLQLVKAQQLVMSDTNGRSRDKMG